MSQITLVRQTPVQTSLNGQFSIGANSEKGLLAADYLHAQVWVWDGKEEKARCWHLLVRREVGANNISHYCLSNAPLDTSWQELARVQAQRFFIIFAMIVDDEFFA